MKQNEKNSITIGVVIVWVIIISLIIIIPLTIAKCSNKKDTEDLKNLENLYFIDYKNFTDNTDTTQKTDDDYYITERINDINAAFVECQALSLINTIDPEDIRSVLSRINQCSKTYLEINEHDDNDEIKTQKSKLKTTLTLAQKKLFPMLRKSFGKEAKNIAWEEDIDVHQSGTTITFTGYHFSLNKNIAAFQNEISNSVNNLRFKRVNYKTTKYDDEYDYYTIKSPKDYEIVDDYK